MKFVKLTLIAALFIIGASFLSPALVRAQEGEPVVVDEVIAQVNDGVVTLSQLKREMKERVQTLVQNGTNEREATAEVEKKKFELVAILINEQLLLQKGKELEFTARGGHVGFVGGRVPWRPDYYAERRIGEWLDGLVRRG